MLLLLLVVVAVAALSYWPFVVASLGLSAFGLRAGLWPGDPNLNDGEWWWATAAGLLALELIAFAGCVAAVAAMRLARSPDWFYALAIGVVGAVPVGYGVAIVFNLGS